MNSFPSPHNIKSITTKTPIKIAQLNANGIDRFPDEVIAFCIKKNIDILLLTETYLLQDRLHTDWQQFHTYAKQHPNAHRGHGGLSILIRPDFPHHVHHQPNTNDYTITITIDKYTIHGLYLPPQLDLTDYNTILQQIPITDTTIILGDLNTRLGASIGDTRTNKRNHTYEEWQLTNNITNWNQTYAFGQPTYRSNIGTSIIDFFMSPTGPTYATEVIIHDQESLNSDHHLCEATFQLDHDIPILSPPTACRKQWKMQRLHEQEIHELYVSTFNEASVPILQRLKSLVNSPTSTTYTCAQAQRDIDDIATEITTTIYTALDDSATPSLTRPKHWKWFWTASLQDLATKRQQCYTKWRAITNPFRQHATWTNYIEAKTNFNNAVKLARAQQWRQFADKLKTSTGNELYQYLKNRKKKSVTTPTFSTPRGPQDAVDKMRQHFATVFGGHRPDITSPYTTTTPFTTPPPLFFDQTFLRHTIESELPLRKAPGKDHITSEMLRPIAHQLSHLLAPLLHLCWRWSYVPSMWRTAQVVPIYKKNDPTDAGNYRPISLTSHFRKIIERALLPVLKAKMTALDLVQGGFRTARGSLDQAFNLHMLIREYRRRYDHQPTLAFLDIKQAYDSVHRDIIWHALQDQGAPPELIALLQNMFEEVSIQIILQNHISSPIHPSTGVLQGSILSPLLYAIFINSLPTALRSGSSQPITIRTLPPSSTSEFKILAKKRKNKKAKRIDTHISIVNSTMFADDVALVGSAHDVSVLLSIAESHSITNGYKWSPSKCELINPSSSYSYTLYDQPLPISTSTKYLGIPFNEYGICKSQMINKSINKAIQHQQALRRMGVHQYGFGLLHAIKAYTTFIRPILEYGLAIVPISPTHQKAIQKCQQTCIRLLLNHNTTAKSPTAIIEHIGNLPTIKLRIKILQFKFLVRINELPPATLIANVIASFLPYASSDDDYKQLTKTNSLWLTYKIQQKEKNKYQEKKRLKEKKRKKKEQKRKEKEKRKEERLRLLNLYFVDTAHPTLPSSDPDSDPSSDSSTTSLDPPSIDSPALLISQHRDTDHQHRQASLTTLSRARPPPLDRLIDPILTVPATSKERHRLVKWRMHWLPPYPTPTCACDNTSLATRSHFITACNKMKDIILQLHLTIQNCHLPPIPTNLNIIDHLLNLLPSDLKEMQDHRSHWQRTWPLIISALLTIDINSHPDAIFEPEPDDHSWLQPTPIIDFSDSDSQ